MHTIALTCPDAIAAASAATEKRLLVALLDRLTYRGRSTVGSVHQFTDDQTGQPVYATRRSVRRLVGADVSSLVVERLSAALAQFADGLESDVWAYVAARTVDRACDLADDAEDDDLRARVAEQGQTSEVLASAARHPAGRRFCRTGGVR